MTILKNLLDSFRNASVSEKEKGTYFEELICIYLRNEALYRDLYSDVWMYSDWATQQGLDRIDSGIDLVARTNGTGEYHAIQCKFYAEDRRLQKSDIDSFFTESGKKPFTHRIIVATTNNWGELAEDALRGQLRIPDESGRDSGGKAATVPAGIRPAFRFDCSHHSGAIRPV